MKKKVLEFVVIILAIIVLFLITNNIRNYIIVSKMIHAEMETRKLECNNYYHQILIKENNSQKIYAITEEFLLDDKYEIRNYIAGKLQVSKVNIDVAKEKIKEGFYFVDDNIQKEILGNYIIKPIILKNNYYVIEFKYANETIYINKDSYLIEIVKQNDTIQTRLLNVVTENDFNEDNLLEEYTDIASQQN